MPPSARPSRRPALIALLVVMVLAQWLGLIHRVAHVEAVPGPVQVRAVQAGGNAKWIVALLHGHQQGGDCQLFDQVTHADVLWTAPTVLLPQAAPVHVPVVHRAWHLAEQAAGFLARGPPSLI